LLRVLPFFVLLVSSFHYPVAPFARWDNFAVTPWYCLGRRYVIHVQWDLWRHRKEARSAVSVHLPRLLSLHYCPAPIARLDHFPPLLVPHASYVLLVTMVRVLVSLPLAAVYVSLGTGAPKVRLVPLRSNVEHVLCIALPTQRHRFLYPPECLPVISLMAPILIKPWLPNALARLEVIVMAQEVSHHVFLEHFRIHPANQRAFLACRELTLGAVLSLARDVQTATHPFLAQRLAPLASPEPTLIPLR
jgi:hypothetical protein